MLSRTINAFAREFRGSDAQRLDPAYHLQEAADIQRFLVNQYQLAPAKGIESVPPVDPPEIDVVYPSWTANAPLAAGTEVGPRRNWAPGFAMTGVKAIGVGISEPVKIEVVGDVGAAGLRSPADRRLVLFPIRTCRRPAFVWFSLTA
jgi:hypothetical protein